jgi:hypothetical protein
VVREEGALKGGRLGRLHGSSNGIIFRK